MIENEPKLYTAYRDGIPYRYAYGDDTDAMALFMDDRGFDTTEEAIHDYNRRKCDG